MTRRIVILILIYTGAIVLFAVLRPNEIDWTPTFRIDQSWPFATQILYQESPGIRKGTIRPTGRPVYNTLEDIPMDSTVLYFILNTQFDPHSLDVEKLLAFVAAGQTVFIASAEIGPQLLDTLGIRMRTEYTGSFIMTDWFYEDNLELSLFQHPGVTWPAATASGFKRFEIQDSVQVDTLGLVNHEYPNFIACHFGNGRIYLHAFPYLFTNYHMLYQNNQVCISESLGYLPDSDITIWDQFYNLEGQRSAQSPFTVFNRYRSFRWAYWTSVAGVLVFILFTAKRRQRIIPLVKAKRNATLDFVRTIGDLYFNRADHSDLIQKKIALLKGQIQKTYRVELSGFSDEEAGHVASRAGMREADVIKLFRYIRSIAARTGHNSNTVRTLQQHLDRFFQRSST